MIEAQVVGHLEVQAKLKAAGVDVHRRVAMAVRELGTRLQGRVKEKLSDDVLHVRSGRLRRSINMKFVDDGFSMTATVGTNVVYARIHEMGGKTAPHVIEARNAKALRFMGSGGNWVFAKRVNHPGSVMPQRSFLRSSLEEMRPMILERLQRAVNGD